MRIYCPYCGTSYDIDESLMPEGNVKVRCRSCANVFVIDREKGAIKDEPEQEYEHEKVSLSENEPASETKKTPADDKDITNVSDFMKKVIQEIDDSLNQENKENESNKNEKPKNISGNKKNKTRYVKIVMLLILILLLIAAGAYTLEYYNIINLPAFLPKLF